MTPGLSMMTAVVDVKPGVLDLDHLIFDLFLQILYMALFDLDYSHIDLFCDTFMLLFVIFGA